MSKKVIFDFNGTIISTMNGVVDLMKGCLEKLTGEEIDREQLVKSYDPDVRVTLDRYGVMSKESFDFVLQTWHDYEVKNTPRYYPFDGMVEVLDELKKANAEIYVWTLRDRQSTLKIIEDNNLQEYFVDIVAGDDGEQKPGIGYAAGKLGAIHPENTFMIGDTYSDIQAGKNLGCKTIGVTWCTTSQLHQLEEEGADHIVSDTNELKQILLG